jgi:hypothetical protein
MRAVVAWCVSECVLFIDDFEIFFVFVLAFGGPVLVNLKDGTSFVKCGVD